jgi:mono/diheme cytochrome c family protein
MDIRKTLPHALGLLGAALALGCFGSRGGLPEPTAKHMEYAGRNGQATSLSALQHGRKLYLNRCSACHALYRPARFQAARWPALVEGMAANAKLNPEQQRDILAYLAAVAAEAQDTAAARPMGGASPLPAAAP